MPWKLLYPRPCCPFFVEKLVHFFLFFLHVLSHFLLKAPHVTSGNGNALSCNLGRVSVVFVFGWKAFRNKRISMFWQVLHYEEEKCENVVRKHRSFLIWTWADLNVTLPWSVIAASFCTDLMHRRAAESTEELSQKIGGHILAKTTNRKPLQTLKFLQKPWVI